jgi:murein DD-endopeptidase MepM/ murein hydrolase activator NlpD
LKHISFIFIIFVFIFSSCGSSKIQKYPDKLEKDIFITVQKNNDGATFYISTTNKFQTMITIQMKAENLRSEVSFPFTYTSIGADKIQIFTLRQINTSIPWNYNFNFHSRAVKTEAIADPKYIYDLPFDSVNSYELIQGLSGSFSHQPPMEFSYDFKMPIGSPILAARDGIVVFCKSDSNEGGADRKYWDDANFINILHEDGTISFYCHLKKNGVLVSSGDKVKKNSLIGYSGNTGYSTAPHLHFEIHKTLDGDTRQTIPFIIRTKSGVLSELKQGTFYQAVH